jgi:serine/threonine protein kinase
LLDTLRCAALSIAQGTVAVLHSRGIIVADLKPENVLLRRPPAGAGVADGPPEVVIADLGSAFSATGTDTSRLAFEMQTLPYRAPEVRAPDQAHAACTLPLQDPYYAKATADRASAKAGRGASMIVIVVKQHDYTSSGSCLG